MSDRNQSVLACSLSKGTVLAGNVASSDRLSTVSELALGDDVVLLEVTPMARLTDPKEETVYLAGFFDGEGSIGMYQLGGPTHSLKIQVGGTHKASIERFQWRFGGVVGFKSGQVSPMWDWVANGELAVDALRAMLPYLFVKRAQAREAIKTPFSGLSGRKLTPEQRVERARIAVRLKELKREVA